MLKLDEIISGFMSQHELPDGSFNRISQLAIRGYRQLHFHSIGQPTSCTLEVLGNKTAKMPCDLLNVLLIGILNGKGEISGLTENPNLGLGDAVNANRLNQPTNDLVFDTEDWVFANPVSNMGFPFFFAQQYGGGSRSDLGFYRLDWTQRVIVFDFQFGYQDVQLFYLPMATDDGVYYVHPLFQEALIGWITWQHMVGNRKYNANDRAEAKEYYDNQLRIARRAQTPFNVSNIYNEFNQTTRLAPRS